MFLTFAVIVTVLVSDVECMFSRMNLVESVSLVLVIIIVLAPIEVLLFEMVSVVIWLNGCNSNGSYAFFC